MSVENVQKFYEAIACDRELRAQLAELSRHHRKEGMDEAEITRLITKKILPLAARMGLGFSLEDLWRHAEQLQQTGFREGLDEHDLDAVVGGSNLCVLTSSSTGASLCACYFIGAGQFPGFALEEPGSNKTDKQSCLHACFLAGNLPPWLFSSPGRFPCPDHMLSAMAPRERNASLPWMFSPTAKPRS